jgi:hypothetical protein
MDNINELIKIYIKEHLRVGVQCNMSDEINEEPRPSSVEVSIYLDDEEISSNKAWF